MTGWFSDIYVDILEPRGDLAFESYLVTIETSTALPYLLLTWFIEWEFGPTHSKRFNSAYLQ